MTKDYYKTLGLERNATSEEIKKAYKRLAKQYHPDLNKEESAAEKFKEINEAAAVLGDEKRKAQYDRYGTAGEGFSGGAGGFDFSDFGGFSGFGVDDLFETFFGGSPFGGRSQRQGPQQGESLQYELEISLEEAYQGLSKTIMVNRNEKCSRCHGSGAESDSDIKTCNTCHGSGVVQQRRRTPFGTVSIQTACSKCRGKGKSVEKLCPVCNGAGTEKKTRKIDVDIPKGVDTGTRIRISGEGSAGEYGAPSGDLYIYVRIKPHEFFERDGADIYGEIPLTITQAALGTELKVPTLQGKVLLKIPAGTQTHTVFKLRGKGLPRLRSFGSGDEHLRVIVETPKGLSKKQKELLKEFEKSLKKKKGLFGR